MTGAFPLLLENLCSSGSIVLSVQHGSAMEPHLGAFPGQYVFSPDGILTGGIATDFLDHLFGVGHAHI